MNGEKRVDCITTTSLGIEHQCTYIAAINGLDSSSQQKLRGPL